MTGAGWEEALLKRLKALVHVDDRSRHDAYLHLLSDDAPGYDSLSTADRRWADMLFFSLWPDGGGFSSVAEGFVALLGEPAFREEARQTLGWALDRAEHVARPLVGRLRDTPLRSHAHYSREELMAALGHATLARTPRHMREGVFHNRELDVDTLLVTLVKSEAHFSPTTMYRDYAINASLFHWESQSGTSVASPTGQRYVTQRSTGSEVLLYVRASKVWEFGGGTPYLLLGDADYVEHRGERPISVTWKLRREMPPQVLQESRAVS